MLLRSGIDGYLVNIHAEVPVIEVTRQDLLEARAPARLFPIGDVPRDHSVLSHDEFTRQFIMREVHSTSANVTGKGAHG